MKTFKIDKNLELRKVETDNFFKKKEDFKRDEKGLNLLLAKSLNIGYYLIAPLLLGVFFGLLIDQYLKTKPLFTLLLIFFGFIATFYNLIKLKREVSQKLKGD